MPSAIAYAVTGPEAAFARTTIERRELGPLDVLIDIAYAGICHSDIHTARNEWGAAHFPLVPGHEITGTVAAVGADVTRWAVGDRVGVGCLVNSCRTCPHCLAGDEQYCTGGKVDTYNSVDRDGSWTDGGYSSRIVVDEHFVVGIPDGLALDVAAPLLCAGITLYSPLRHWNAGPGRRVAIVGLGGLGHMGVKLAHAMGADVTVLSQSGAKEADAYRLGADAYFATSSPDTFEKLAGSFDLVVSTVSAVIPMDDYLSLLARDGALVTVGSPPEPLSLAAFSLISMRRSFAGSLIGGLAETQEMLDFCSAHGLGAEIEVIDAASIDAAWDRVVASDVRYRFVIDVATF
jgi:uncharacterized zinc-type alcohol dehydrogenase-like protein